MRLFTPLLLLFWLSSSIVVAEQTQLLRYTGSEIEAPHWFKDSFLDLSEDIEDASDSGKKLMIYYHQAGCPYCYNLVQQSFLDPALSQYIQAHFDLIALNLWGDREVTLPDGAVLSEKELAKKWKIQYTPTLLFFDGGDEPVLRIDGYRSREMMAKILDYVVSGNTETSLAQTLITLDQSASLYPSTTFKTINPPSEESNAQPIALLFEYPGCEDCIQLHKQVLSRSDTFKQLERYRSYRIDVSKEKEFSFPNGSVMNGADYATSQGLTYFPSVLLLDSSGKEKLRIDGYVQSFHFNTALEYVRDKVYLREPEFQRYINERADRLREQGENVVITQ